MQNLPAPDIARTKLFAGVGLEAVESLLELCHQIEAGAGQILIEREKVNENVYVLLEGRLDVHLSSVDEPCYVSVEVGDCVGEMSIIEDRETSASVIVAAQSRLLVIPREVMWSLIHASHGVARNMLYTLSSRLRRGNEAVNNSMHLQIKFESMAFVDGLTGLHNRRWLDQAFRRQVERGLHDGKPVTILMTDIDHFKLYNDTYGHLSGDKALNAVALALNDHLRPGDLLARYGGEEFAILLPDTDGTNAHAISERLRLAVERAHLNGAQDIHPMSVSIGHTQLLDGDTLENVLERADAALYLAKSSGRNCVRSA